MESQQAAFEKFNRQAAAGRSKAPESYRKHSHEGRGADRSSGVDGPLPDLYSIHKGKVVRIEDFGAFIQIPGYRKHGLVHKTQASKHFLEHISDMVALEDSVWVKVINLQEDKIALSMKYVSQSNGTDLDPNLIQLTEAEDRKRVHTGFVDKGPISIEDGGVLRKTVCKKCGALGHLAADCFSGGEKFDLLTDGEDDDGYGARSARTESTGKDKKSKDRDRHKDKKDRDKDKDKHMHKDRKEKEGTRDRRERHESSSHRKEKRRDRSRSTDDGQGTVKVRTARMTEEIVNDPAAEDGRVQGPALHLDLVPILDLLEEANTVGILAIPKTAVAAMIEAIAGDLIPLLMHMQVNT
ncbi:Nucleolar protein of 40 kDa [Mortierella sp. NVP85]|nr:Nucleolar protein of 40 kDa [Mortierella sp. NVP85]